MRATDTEHAVARALCFKKFGDYRYDPGNPRHERWLLRAKDLLAAFKACGLTVGDRDA